MTRNLIVEAREFTLTRDNNIAPFAAILPVGDRDSAVIQEVHVLSERRATGMIVTTRISEEEDDRA